MSYDKNRPPFVAHFDGNQISSIIGVVGTLGTADTGGTSLPLPIGVNPDTGAMYVQDLSGASGTTNVQIVGGTFNAGTVTANIATGTQQTLGTVGTVIGVGTISNIVTTSGTVTGVGTITNLGSITNIGNLPTLNLTTGTVTTGSLTDLAKLYNGSVNILTGTIQSSGTTTGVGTITNIGSVTNVGNSGTTTGVGVVTTVTTVSNQTNGTTRISVGTITTGSLTNLAGLNSGTINLGTFVNNGGTIQNLNYGTIAINAKPAGSAILTSHTLGTGGGTFFGTLIAPVGAGTYIYLTGFSIVARAGGTIDIALANNVAGTTGAGVIFRGAIPTAGGGIARDLNPALRLGTNGTLAYALITAGTADISYTYWVGP